MTDRRNRDTRGVKCGSVGGGGTKVQEMRWEVGSDAVKEHERCGFCAASSFAKNLGPGAQ